MLAGDIFYEADTAERALAFVTKQASLGATVLIGDPGRSYLPKERLTKLAEYSVPVTRELEDNEIKRTAVWTLRRLASNPRDCRPRERGDPYAVSPMSRQAALR